MGLNCNISWLTTSFYGLFQLCCGFFSVLLNFARFCICVWICSSCFVTGHCAVQSARKETRTKPNYFSEHPAIQGLLLKWQIAFQTNTQRSNKTHHNSGIIIPIQLTLEWRWRFHQHHHHHHHHPIETEIIAAAAADATIVLVVGFVRVVVLYVWQKT